MPVFFHGKRSAYSLQSQAAAGFTLIELLVVIAIISILAAILFPVFAQAREKARQSSCLSNLKQMGLGIMQYTQDFDECYPLSATHAFDPTTGTAAEYMEWAVRIDPYVKNTQIYRCPTAVRNEENVTLKPGGVTVTYPGMFNYGVNEFVISAGTPGSRNENGVSLTMIGASSLLPIVADSKGPVWTDFSRVMNSNDPSLPWYNTPATAVPRYARHANGSNLIFADGHAKFTMQSAMGPDPARVTVTDPPGGPVLTSAYQYQQKLPIVWDDDRLK